MASSSVTVFVCVSCQRTQAGAEAGASIDLVDTLRKGLAETSAQDVEVTPVDCLAVCKRPITIAITATGKWTYLIGDLVARDHAGEIVQAALSYQRSENGIIPWKERPASFRRGVIARVPPVGFVMSELESA